MKDVWNCITRKGQRKVHSDASITQPKEIVQGGIPRMRKPMDWALGTKEINLNQGRLHDVKQLLFFSELLV